MIYIKACWILNIASAVRSTNYLNTFTSGSILSMKYFDWSNLI